MNARPNPQMVVLAREMRGITQKELCLKVPNLTQGNLSRMEKGLLNITSETLTILAEELEFPVKFSSRNSSKSYFELLLQKETFNVKESSSNYRCKDARNIKLC